MFHRLLRTVNVHAQTFEMQKFMEKKEKSLNAVDCQDTHVLQCIE